MSKLNMKEWINEIIQKKEVVAMPIMTHPGIEMIGQIRPGERHPRHGKPLSLPQQGDFHLHHRLGWKTHLRHLRSEQSQGAAGGTLPAAGRSAGQDHGGRAGGGHCLPLSAL